MQAARQAPACSAGAGTEGLVMLRRPAAVVTAGLWWAAVGASFGAEVLFTVSSQEPYVGVPVQIQIIIKDATEHEAPEFPEIEDAEVRPPGRAEPDQGRVPQGGRRERLITYTYTVIPLRAGTLTIPPIRVIADGESFSSAPIRIVAKKSEAGDLLYVRLVSQRQSVYVGEPIDVTLEIWLKPYEAKNVQIADAEDLWLHAVDEQASTWGPFAENLEGGTRNITFPTETRPDAYGGSQRYFVYSLNRRVWPHRPGLLGADEVKVAVDYPLRVRHRRVTRVGCPHDVVESRPISAVVEDSRIVVKALPADDRPESFRGAVGKYTIMVAATPTEVSVGDPITLTLTIRGTGRMDLLQAPLLAEQETLTADFRVPDEELPGAVSGMVKSFTQTIRTKHDGVDRVPPIEFSYFDAHLEQYVTLNSDPIPLQVRESTQLPVSGLAGSRDSVGERPPLMLVESGLLANYGDVEALLRQHSMSLGWGTWGFAVSGPLLCLACWLIRWHRDRLAGDAGFRRRRSARKTALAAIRRATTDPGESPSASPIAAAVTGYLADRCNLPLGSVTRTDVISELRLRDLPEALINEVDALLAECETAQYGASRDAVGGDLAELARSCVNSLERREF